MQQWKSKQNRVIALSGILDIFEAGSLYMQIIEAVNDTDTASLRIDLTQVERIDASAYQIIRSVCKTYPDIRVTVGGDLTKKLANTGMRL